MDWVNRKCAPCDDVGKKGPIIAPLVILSMGLLVVAFGLCHCADACDVTDF